MTLPASLPVYQGTPFIVDTARMVHSFAAFGLRPAALAEVPDAMALAEALTHQTLASASVIGALHAESGTTVLVTGQPTDGMFLNVLLSEAGERAVRDGTFTAANVPRAHVAGIGETCFGLYTGVYAGKTREARRNIMQASASLRVDFFASVPLFARGATEDGARSMASLGFHPAHGGLPDLWVHEPLTAAKGEAA
jgi:hypothetical protein